jgi:hypothetical protein
LIESSDDSGNSDAEVIRALRPDIGKRSFSINARISMSIERKTTDRPSVGFGKRLNRRIRLGMLKRQPKAFTPKQR